MNNVIIHHLASFLANEGKQHIFHDAHIQSVTVTAYELVISKLKISFSFNFDLRSLNL